MGDEHGSISGEGTKAAKVEIIPTVSTGETRVVAVIVVVIAAATAEAAEIELCVGRRYF